MKERLIAAAVLAAGLAFSGLEARAAFKTGTDLGLDCTSTLPYHNGLCPGFILGIFDALASDNDVNGATACPPEGLSVGAVEDVVVKWLSENQRERYRSAAGIVAEALANARP